MPVLARYAAPEPAQPRPADVKRVLEIMRAAKHPLIVLGRAPRGVAAWEERVALAEALNARVMTDLKAGASFPTDHPLHIGRPSAFPTPEGKAALREADAILSLEPVDLAGLLKVAGDGKPPAATIINCSMDRFVHNGWSMDHQALPPADVDLAVPAEALVSALLDELGRPVRAVARNGAVNGAAHRAPAEPADPTGEMGFASFCAGLNDAFAGRDVCYIRLPLGANEGAAFTFHHPLDYLGGDGAGGVGAGPGLAVGAALALRGTGRLPVAVLGDGDYLMGLTALWTAVANDIPLLVIVANNNCYNNDVAHQDRVARQRGRPVERKWIGQMITEPTPDLAMLARGQGAVGIGRVDGRRDLAAALAEAITHVEAGKVCVVDAYVSPDLDQRVAAAAAAAAAT
jgi:thiamine pyrophosphate-dependent acetolactate synthase large subunit-like protein